MRWTNVLVALLSLPVLAPDPIRAADRLVPSQEDWLDFGWILDAGVEGDWDRYLAGMLTASATKKEASYFLYYGGACCYSEPLDSVTFRAIGVATSSDGIRFSKHQQNPVVSWLPNNGREEGATASAVAIDSTNQTVLYFAANTQETRTTVNADVRVGTSADGLRFEDMGLVLDHQDRSIWGSGDEIFPIIALQHEKTWILYYLTNGVPQQRHLGVAWGSRRDRLTNSRAVKSDGRLIPVWGVGGGAALVAANTYALFLNDIRIPRTEIRTFSGESPYQLSAPIETYQWTGVKQATILLDRKVGTWFLYYRDSDQRHYGIKLAPFDQSDKTPPSSPGALVATVVDPATLRLTWTGATDLDTGIAQYLVYKDGEKVEATAHEFFQDSGLRPGEAHSYQVSAMNFHGTEGTLTPSITVDIARP